MARNKLSILHGWDSAFDWKKKFGLIYTGKHLGSTCETISVCATFGNETC